MKKRVVVILLLLSLIGICIETMPLNATTQIVSRVLKEELSVFQGFRLLAVEGHFSGDARMRSAEYFVDRLTHFPNWNNNTFPSYVQLLSEFNETEITDECRKFYAGNATKFNVQRLITDFLGQAGINEFIVFYCLTDGGQSIVGLDELITAAELSSWLGALKGTVCVVFDACHSGSWVNDGAGSTFGQNKIVLCSSRSDQLSYGVAVPLWGGCFTGFENIRYNNGTKLPLGLIGSMVASRTDLNQDGWLSIQECFQYAKSSTEQITTAHIQNPVSFNGLPDNYDPPLVQLQPPKPPVANFTYSPPISWINETTTFNATQSTSPNGNITSYQWDFGDGNITTVLEPIINHTYNLPGKYTVALNVTDTYGQWNTTSSQITVTYTTDLNKDGKVNIQDITIVAIAYKTKPGDEKWNEIADLDRSGEVNIVDVTMVAKDYGKTL